MFRLRKGNKTEKKLSLTTAISNWGESDKTKVSKYKEGWF